MRPELIVPTGGIDKPEIIRDALLMVGVSVPEETITGWAPLERALACDWALREHLHASDSRVQRRPKPAFLDRPGKGKAWDSLKGWLEDERARGFSTSPELVLAKMEHLT